MNKNKFILFFIAMIFLSSVKIEACEHDELIGIEIDIFNDIENSMANADISDCYDEYDIEVESMELRNVPIEEPKPVSTVQYWLRRCGSPLLLNYLVMKIYMKHIWASFILMLTR